jgi:hypothetical protein
MATYKLVNWVDEIYDQKIEVVVKTVVCALPIFIRPIHLGPNQTRA